MSEKSGVEHAAFLKEGKALAFTLHEGERLDDLVRDGMRIIQRPDQFCFSIDSVLLAHFVRLRRRDRLVDLGTGTGVIPLLLTALGAGDVTGIENNPVMADLARRNVAGNHRESAIRIVEGDYTEPAALFPTGTFTAAVVNPPYREVGRGALNGREDVAAACHELTASLEDVFRAAAFLLGFGGRLFMVHRADRTGDLLAVGRTFHMEAKRLRFVHSHGGEPAVRVLGEWKYGGHPGLVVEPPLIVHNTDGSYTEEVLAIYGKQRA